MLSLPVGGCHRAWLSHFHTLFTTHYYLSITCNYPSWWLMECFPGWVGEHLGLSCWGLCIITRSLSRARRDDDLRGATCQRLGGWVHTLGGWKQAVVFMLCCVKERNSGVRAVWALAAGSCHCVLWSVRPCWLFYFLGFCLWSNSEAC